MNTLKRKLLDAQGVAKEYPGVVALSGVDLMVHTGEIRALIGENGSGKSTLAKILYGGTVPDRGRVDFNGFPLAFGKPARSLNSGIVAISQELTLSPELSVAENILMGQLPTRFGVVSWRETFELADAHLRELGFGIDPRSRVGDLSIELQQGVEICRALSRPASLIILDEATSSLSKHAAELLLTRVVERSERGTAVLLITHRMHEVREVAHTATILRDGHLIATTEVDDVSDDDILRMMVGREVRDVYGSRSRSFGDVVLRLNNVSARDGSFSSLSLNVRSGEIVGVAGLVGCGKSELALAIAGGIIASGSLKVDEVEVEPGSVRRSIRHGIALIPEDRKRQGLLPTMDVLDNMAIPWNDVGVSSGIISRKNQAAVAERLGESLELKASSLAANILTLSGGNQQKVLVARWLPRSPRVLVLVEPTRGVDVGAKAAIYEIIQGLAAEGIAILLVSSELPEILGLSDRILVMFEGRITAELSGDTATEREVAEWVLGRDAA